MPERATTPPFRKPVQELNSPCQTNGFFTELVQRTDASYQKLYPIKRGTPYASGYGADERIIAQYADNPLFFLKQIRPGNASSSDFGSTDLEVLWIWATDQLSQDSYNSEVTYEEDGVDYPVFTREYEVRRKAWEANPTIAPTSTLTGLLSVAITNPGTGYTQATATNGNSVAEAVILPDNAGRGPIIDWIVTVQGSAIVANSGMTITGDGAGAAATARIQPASAVLINQKKDELPEENPWSHDYVRIIRTYATMPGPVLTNKAQSQQVRGREVDVTIQKGLVGTLSPETGNNIISSETQQISTVVEQRTTTKVASLPPDEKWATWEFVPLPLLIFDIVNTFYCNNSQFFTLVTNPVKSGGSSVLRKHRVTRKYYNAYPNPDLSGSSFTTADLDYRGKAIQFQYGNVLNDAISYSANFYNSSSMLACFWTESYDFPATTPSATDFLAGDWFVRSFAVREWGESGYISELTEYYSAEGDPAI